MSPWNMRKGLFYSNTEQREKMVVAEQRQVDELVKKIIELKNRVCSDNDENFLAINRKGIDPPSLVLFVMTGNRLCKYWDVNYYKRRQMREEGGMNFVESVFSFVFGDGDPNQVLEEEGWKLIGQYISSNGGVVAAEELAPYLDVSPIEETQREKMIVAERRQVDELVKKIIELKNRVCSDNDENFLVINRKGIGPPSLVLFVRAGAFLYSNAEQREKMVVVERRQVDELVKKNIVLKKRVCLDND